MIKILKRGEIPENVIYEAECFNCKTTYTFAKADAIIKQSGYNETTLRTKCPVCGKDVDCDWKKHVG